jgi:UDP-N-acetylglucosamine 1-carboxyvinyltransferase
MSVFIVKGGTRLFGEIKTSGNKNEALPVISAAILLNTSVSLFNVPDIGDVNSMLSIASELGAKISKVNDSKVIIDSCGKISDTLPFDTSGMIRGSILFASSLLGRNRIAKIPQPGGDPIGRRRLDTHFLVFKTLGAKISCRKIRNKNKSETTMYVLEAKNGLKGSEIYLDEASVTATENAIIAASCALGKTTIINAASEPHVQQLCRFMQKAGVKIEGIGSNIITIYGTKNYKSVNHTIGSDYIESGSYIGLAAATRSELKITNVDLNYMKMIIYQFARLGIRVETDSKRGIIYVPKKQNLRVCSDLGGAIPKIEDNIWPAFPADLMSIMVVVATQVRGTCLIHEKMFESRLFFVDKLISMGAHIIICDPHRAVVSGPSQLVGATISSPDIRAGMAMLIAACAAKGVSRIYNIEQIDRGYEKIDQKLLSIGVNITRIQDRRKNC